MLNLRFTWVLTVMLALTSALAATCSTATAAEPVDVAPSPFKPSYLCLCHPCFLKPLPCLPGWDYECCCDDYCRKPLPAHCVPPMKYCCDDYCCKPEPCPLPVHPCPPRWNYVERVTRLPPIGE